MATKVLIIDDDEVDRMALKRVIKKWRRRVEVVEAGGLCAGIVGQYANSSNTGSTRRPSGPRTACACVQRR